MNQKAIFCICFEHSRKYLFQVHIIRDMFNRVGYNRIGYIQFGIISQVFHPLLTTCLAPLIILIILNYKIFIGSSRINVTSQDTNLSTIMIAIVSVFVILNIPKIVLTLFEVTTIPDIISCRKRGCPYQVSSGMWLADGLIRENVQLTRKILFFIVLISDKEMRAKGFILTSSLRYLVLLNSSANFLIYCFVGSNFRKTLRTKILFCSRNSNQEAREEEPEQDEDEELTVGGKSCEEDSVENADQEAVTVIGGGILVVSRC